MTRLEETIDIEYSVKLLKEMVEKESRFLKSIFSTAPLAIMGISPDNRIIAVNQKATELFHLSEEKILSSDIKDLIPGIDPFLNGGSNLTIPWENSVICWKSSLIKNDDGEIAGSMLFGMTFETMSSKTVQDERLEAIKDFLCSFAHDLNNLLGAISGYSSILQTFRGYDEKFLNYFRALDNSIKRMSEMIAKSIRFATHVNLNRQKVVLRNKLDGLCRKLAEKYPNHSIRKSFEDSQKPIEVDWIMIEEALTALLDNAVESMQNGGTIQIMMDESAISDFHKDIQNHPNAGNYIRITIQDEGEGMDKDTIARAFMPFFSTRDKGKGSGMGLTIAYFFIKQNNGYLTLESQKGKGTTASVYLPVKNSIEKIDIDDADCRNKTIS